MEINKKKKDFNFKYTDDNELCQRVERIYSTDNYKPKAKIDGDDIHIIYDDEMMDSAILVAYETSDTDYICQLFHFFLYNNKFDRAKKLYELAKEKGYSDPNQLRFEWDYHYHKYMRELSGHVDFLEDDDDSDYARDTWYALTDGNYGDYPGPGVDYDFLGFD